MKGILPFDHMLNKEAIRRREKAVIEWWREYDLMDDYRNEIPLEDQRRIFTEMDSEQSKYQRRTGNKRRSLYNSKSLKLRQASENPEVNQLAAVAKR